MADGVYMSGHKITYMPYPPSKPTHANTRPYTPPHSDKRSRPTPMPDEPIINFHASQTEVITGEPVTLTRSVANSIRKPDMALQLVLQLPANWSASGEGIGESCFSQCNATYKVPTGESRDFQLIA